jgi:hypothetical protein
MILKEKTNKISELMETFEDVFVYLCLAAVEEIFC